MLNSAKGVAHPFSILAVAMSQLNQSLQYRIRNKIDVRKMVHNMVFRQGDQ